MQFYDALKILITQKNVKFRRKIWDGKYNYEKAFICYGFNGTGARLILLSLDAHTGYTYHFEPDDIVANDWYIVK